MGRKPCCEKEVMNRGAWTAMEDKILTDYISLHGQGNWRKLPINAGLKRCGKSCRLRWLNYLKPDIKRGNITREEEDLIIRLHKLLGNRWSLIAGRLPGRTDNEIKNYWNTNIGKKLQGDGPKNPLHFHNQDKPRPSSTSLHRHDHHQKPPAPTSVVRTKATRLTKVVISEELHSVQQKTNVDNPEKKPFEVTSDNTGSIPTLLDSPQGVLEPGPTWALDESNWVDWVMDVDMDDHILSKDLEAHELLLDTNWITSFLESELVEESSH